MSSALATAIRRLAPSSMLRRAAEALPFEPVAERTIGVFQLYHVLPQQRLQLHIFEPRYRGLVARALQREPRTFAMCGPGAQVLCEVEITSTTSRATGATTSRSSVEGACAVERDWQDNSNLRVAVVSELTDDAVLPQQEATLRRGGGGVDGGVDGAHSHYVPENVGPAGSVYDGGPRRRPPSDFEALGLGPPRRPCMNELSPLAALRATAPCCADIRLHVLRETDFCDECISFTRPSSTRASTN